MLVAGLPTTCAFAGVNPNAPSLPFNFPIGRSVYNGMDVKLTQNVKNPVRGILRLNLQVSYSLSRFVNSGGSSFGTTGFPGAADQDFVVTAQDQRKPNRYMGPSLLDRTHQFSFGGFADLPGGFQLSAISHFYSPISLPLIVPTVTGSFL